MRLTKNVKNVLTVTVLAILLYAAGYFLVGQTFIPQNFIDARANVAKTAGELMTMVAASQANLDRISQYHESNDFPKALELVNQELVNGKLSFNKEQVLAAELNDMSNAATGITPIKARNLAEDAMQQEIILMGKLIEYNDLLKGLLQSLQLKFSGAIKDNSSEIQVQIGNMNTTGKEVNDLNGLFNQKMDEFDKLTK